MVAANSGFYGFGRLIAPDARVDDGLLDVVVVRDAPKRLFFTMMNELKTGAHLARPQVEVVRGREIRIEADRDCRTARTARSTQHCRSPYASSRAR